jgi:hypothetical protein
MKRLEKIEQIGSGIIILGLLSSYWALSVDIYHELQDPIEQSQAYDEFQERQEVFADIGDMLAEAKEQQDERDENSQENIMENRHIAVEDPSPPYSPPPPPEMVAQQLHNLQGKYISIDKQIHEIEKAENAYKSEATAIMRNADELYSDYAYTKELDKRVAELAHAGRANTQQWHSLEKSRQQAHDYFRNKYGFDVDRAPQEIESLRQQAKSLEDYPKNPQLESLKESREKTKVEYHVQKSIAKCRPDYQKIETCLAQLEKAHGVDEISKGRLNRLTAEERQQVLSRLTPEQVQKFMGTEQTVAHEH